MKTLFGLKLGYLLLGAAEDLRFASKRVSI